MILLLTNTYTAPILESKNASEVLTTELYLDSMLMQFSNTVMGQKIWKYNGYYISSIMSYNFSETLVLHKNNSIINQ